LKLNKNNNISIEYYRLDKSIFVVNIIVVNIPIQWYDIVSSPLSPWENINPWASQAAVTS
jgi:hypothetical protein